jgi:hypothetical protein
MDKLISYCAKAETSERFKQFLCALFISSWYSKPFHENQIFAENRSATIKATTNRVMSFAGAPATILASCSVLHVLIVESPCKGCSWL